MKNPIKFFLLPIAFIFFFQLNAISSGIAQAIISLEEHDILVFILSAICIVTVISFIVIYRNRVSILKMQKENDQLVERYRSLVKQSSEGIYLFDPVTFQILETNHQFLHLLGYSEDEILKLKTMDIVVDESDSLLNNIEKIINKHEIISSERKYRKKDGSFVELGCKGSLIEFSNSSVVMVNVRDITERKQMVEALRNSEELHRELIKESPVGIVVTDSKGNITNVNPAVLQILGSPNEAATLKFNMLTLPTLVEAGISKQYQDVILNKANISVETDYTSVWGKTSKIKFQIVPLFDESENVTGTLTIAEDISERKIKEEQLKESEERFRLLVESIPLPVVIASLENGTISFENEYLPQLFGVNPGEMVGRKTTDFYINAEERNKIITALGSSHLVSGIDILGKRANGDVINLLVSATVVKYNGIPSILSTFSDITSRIKAEAELIENEEKFRSIFENMAEGFYQVDEEGKFIIANNALIKMLGYENESEFMGANLEADIYVNLSERAQVRQQAFQLHSRKYTEVIWKKKNGSQLAVSINERIVWGKKNNFKYFEAIVIDISELKKAELARKDLEEQLIQTQKLESLGTLAGGIAHDFNNVLSMILLASESLKRHSDGNKEIAKYSDIISSSAERGATIAKQLLLFARSEKVNLQPISLTHIVNEVISLIHHSFPKSIEIKTDFIASNGIIMGNGGHLQQVIMNLAINARDAMISENILHTSGKLTFKISTVNKENISRKFVDLKNDIYVVLTISDTGTGMDDETIQRIFEPFFTTKSRGKGTGLGLSIVHGIIQSHDGFIDVESELGKGTDISIYFPAVTQQDDLPVKKVPHFDGKGSETILIVDDEGLLRETMMNALTNSGYYVLDAKHGIQAIEIYKENLGNIDLVITDLGMPYMDGEELFFNLKSLNPDIHVIVSTGYLEKGSKEEMIAKGIKDVVLKPYRIKELLEAVRNVLDRKSGK